MVRSIPQVHDGIRYRSRTEARWGEFWMLAGLAFEYEPEGFDIDGEWYVPDFRVGPVLFEIKGVPPTEREVRVAGGVSRAASVPVVMAIGNPGAATLHAYGVGKTPTSCVIVEEFRCEAGAWLAEFADGGGWAIPLGPGLVNCAASGAEHPLLKVAGRLQFQAARAGRDDGDFVSLATAVARLRDKIERMSKGDSQ